MTEVSETLLNWSGGELRLPSGYTFDAVYGRWPVPSVDGTTSAPPELQLMSEWVGIDGDQVFDLVQSGTTSQVQINPDGTRTHSFYPWTELLPLQPTEQVISNIPVLGGSSVEVHVVDVRVVTAPSGRHTVTANVDFTSNAFAIPITTTVSMGPELLPFASAPQLNQAEWIAERPSLNNGSNYSFLGNYGATYMELCGASVTNIGDVGNRGGASVYAPVGSPAPSVPGMYSVNITMEDAARTILADADTSSEYTIGFTWRAKGQGEHT